MKTLNKKFLTKIGLVFVNLLLVVLTLKSASHASDLKTLDVESQLSVALVSETLSDVDILVQGLDYDEIIFINEDTPVDTILNRLDLLTFAEGGMIDHLAIFSHGLSGEFELGNEMVDAARMMNSPSVYRIGSYLTPEAELLLYGCEVAAGDKGVTFIEKLTLFIPVRIYASDDLTGINGDWSLEVSNSTEPPTTYVDEDFLTTNYTHNLQCQIVACPAIPVITNVTPLVAPTGTTIQLEGSNLAPQGGVPTVYLGGVPATVLNASNTVVEVSIPARAAYERVMLTNGCDLVAHADIPIDVTGCDLTLNTGSYSLGFSGANSSRNTKYQVVLYDLDEDGYPEVIGPNLSSPGVNVWRNTSSPGNISFASPIFPNGSSGARTTIVADFDGDGKPDLASSAGGSLYINRNTSVGSLSFGGQVRFNNSGFYQLYSGDLDGDGKIDIVTTNRSSAFYYFRNTSTGPGNISFANQVQVLSGGACGVVVVDVDGDGRPEVVTSGLSTNRINVHRNTSAGPGSISFANASTFATGGSGPYRILSGDYNGDGQPDFATCDWLGNRVSVFINQSTGAGNITFQLNTYPSNRPYRIAHEDLDGDGDVDIITQQQSNINVDVYLNNGMGTFNRVTFNSGTGNIGVAAGDLDGDLVPEIILGSRTGAQPLGFKAFTVNNNCNQPPVAICADYTVAVDANCSATITGADIDDGSNDPDLDALTFALDDAGPFGIGTHVVTLTVSDGTRSDACTATVTVEDNTPPALTCQNPSINLGAGGVSDVMLTDEEIMVFTEDFLGDLTGSTNLEALSNWTVTNCGNVDVTDIPGIAGQEVELAGTTNATIETTQNLSLLPGDYRLAFSYTSSVATNQLTLAVGTVFSQTYPPSGAVQNVVETFSVATGTDATISFSETGTDDADGTQIGAISLVRIVEMRPTQLISLATDNCGLESFTVSELSFDCDDVASSPIAVTVTATDVGGNTVSCQSMVTVTDTDNLCCDIAITSATPTAEVCPGDDDGQIVVAASCTTCTSISYSISPDPNGVNPQSGGTFMNLPDGTYTVTVTDSGRGSCTSSQANVIVAAGVDTEDPVIMCPGGSLAVAYSETFDLPNKGVSGNCTGSTPNTCSSSDFSGVDWILGDVSAFDNGSDFARTQADGRLLIQDSNRPSYWQSPSITTVPGGEVTFGLDLDYTLINSTNFIDIRYSTDGGSTFQNLSTIDGTGGVTTIDPGGSESLSGTITINESGITAGSSFLLRVVVQNNSTGRRVYLDNITISTQAGVIVVDNDPGLCSAVVTLTDPIFSDNCSAVLTSNALVAYPVGSTPVVFTATDPSGNSASCTQTVQVNDTEDPMATCKDITVQLDGSGMATITPADVENDGTCPGTVTLYSGTNFTGTSQVLVFGDYDFPALNSGIGNDNTRSVRVTPGLRVELFENNIVGAGQTLVLTGDTPNIGSLGNGVSSAVVSCAGLPPAASSDNCTAMADLIFSLSQDSFDCDDVNPSTPVVTVLTVTDEAGNQSTCDVTVTVEDNILPTFTCPNNQEVDLDGNCDFTVPDLISGLVATDNCDVTFEQTPMASTVVNNLNDGDSQVVTIVATDQGGNTNATACMVTLTANNPGTVAISDVTINEGDAGATTFDFTVTLTNPGCAFSVDYATANNGAIAGTDYVATSGTLNFAAGQSSQTISVTVNGDTDVEFDDEFFVNLTNATNGVSITDAQGLGIITNDDAAEISITDVSQVEMDAANNMVFTVSLSEMSVETITVMYATTDGTAMAGSDYTATTGTITFAPGSQSETITVPILGETVVESDETFTVTLSAPTNATIAATMGAATGTIENDDAAAITLNDITLDEGTGGGTTNFTFAATLDNPVQGGFDLAYTTNDGTAAAGSDYTDNDGTLTFTGTMNETQTITVLVDHDAMLEADETFTVLLGALSNLGAGVDASDVTVQATGGDGVITNDDAASITLNDITLDEGTGGGATNFTFTATLDNPVQGGFDLAYTTNDGTAAAGSDYTDNDGTLTFTGTMNETQTITVLVDHDAMLEADETFTVLLGALSNLGAGVEASDVTVQATGGDGVITNDDSASITLNDITLDEGTGGGTTNFTFTATLDNPVQGGFDLAYTTNDGTATLADSDYTDNDGALSFAGTMGETQMITVLVNHDNTVEPDETFTVLLGALSNLAAGVVAADITVQVDGGDGVITNDDSAVLDIADVSDQEANSPFDFEVTLTNPLTVDITFTVSTTDGTATSGDSDYVPLTNMAFTIPAGQTSVLVPVSVINNNVNEPDEAFTVSIANAMGSPDLSVGDGVATGTILNDDPVTISIDDVTTTEGNAGQTGLVFTVSLDAMSSQSITVDFTTQDGAATTLNNDYAATSGTLVFSPGQMSQMITVQVIGDLDVELDEQFTVLLSNPTIATIADDTGTGTIENDDAAIVVLDPAGATVTEGDVGNTPMSFPVSLTGGPVDVDVVINYVLTDGTAMLADSDYSDPNSGTITLPAGQSTADITVFVTGDTNNEDDESFSLTITNIDATGRDVTLGNATAPGNIIDDDFTCPTLGAITGEQAICISEDHQLSTTGLMTMAGAENNELDFGIRYVYFTAATADPYTGGTDLGTVDFANLEAGGTEANLDVTFPAAVGEIFVYAVLSPTPTEPTCRPSLELPVNVYACGITNDDDTNPMIADPCSCKDNATTLIDGQFDELVQVFDAPAGQTWTVVAIDGLFQSSSPAPPMAPIAIGLGTTLTEVPTATPGVSDYELTGVHVDGIGYSIMVSNGTTTLALSNRCWYPNPSFDNLAASYCRTNGAVTLLGSAQLGDGSGEATPESETFMVINVESGATVVNAAEGSAILDVANLPAGRYRVIFTFNGADDDPDQSHPGCSQSIEQEFEILEVNCGTFPWGGN